MVKTKTNKKVLARNERIRKKYSSYIDKKHYSVDYSLKLLEDEFLPLKKTTIWLIVTQTGFYKNY